MYEDFLALDEITLKEIQEIKQPFFTPDMYLLEQHAHHLLFDPGPKRYNLPHVCTAYTHQKMSLFENKNKVIPIRMPLAPRGRVAGTLYIVDTLTIKIIDKEMGNGLDFKRAKIPVILPLLDSKGDFERQEVWSYSGLNERWEKEILWELDFLKRDFKKREFRLADRYLDNHPFLNNHFAYSAVKVEHLSMSPYEPIEANRMSIIKYHCKKKNDLEILKLNLLRTNNELEGKHI